MSSKKIVLRVRITGDQCKTACSMSVAAKFEGIKSMAVDGEKGTLTVVGEVDVVCLVAALRKAKFVADVVSVGPEKEPNKAKEADLPKPPPPTTTTTTTTPTPTRTPTHCCCSVSGGASCGHCCPGPMSPYRGGVVWYEEQDDGYGCVIQ